MTHPLNVIALIPAAGASLRLGELLPKPLVEIAGRSILSKSIDRLASCGKIDRFVVIHPPGMRPSFEQAVDTSLPIEFCEGGSSRQLSVANGLGFVFKKGLVSEKTIVVVHDAARCLVSGGLTDRVIEKARVCGAATAALPLVDSITMVDKAGRIEKSLSREGVWRIQTPQAFHFGLLMKAHAAARQKSRGDYTDDTAIVAPHCEVHVVEGERTNIKITTQEDLKLSEILTRLANQPINNLL